MTSVRKQNKENAIFTHCLVEYDDFDQTKKVVEKENILNPSNRRLKAGEKCTLKSEGRNHIRVKILFCGTALKK